MPINLVVAVTDDDWFEMLRWQPNLTEVNFWAPSASNFRALQPGELFLFKLHAPRNVIVGGGIFAYANVLPCSLAWDAFREANVARSAQGMRNRIAKYRRSDPSDRSDFAIGCRILTQPFFFEEADWIPVPKSWSSYQTLPPGFGNTVLIDRRNRICFGLKIPRCGLMSGMRSPSKTKPGFSSFAVRWSCTSLSIRIRSKAARRMTVSRS